MGGSASGREHSMSAVIPSALSAGLAYTANRLFVPRRRLAKRSTLSARAVSAKERSRAARLPGPGGIPAWQGRKRTALAPQHAELRHRICRRTQGHGECESSPIRAWEVGQRILHHCTRWAIQYGRRGSTRASRGQSPFWPGANVSGWRTEPKRRQTVSTRTFPINLETRCERRVLEAAIAPLLR